MQKRNCLLYHKFPKVNAPKVTINDVIDGKYVQTIERPTPPVGMKPSDYSLNSQIDAGVDVKAAAPTSVDTPASLSEIDLALSKVVSYDEKLESIEQKKENSKSE